MVTLGIPDQFTMEVLSLCEDNGSASLETQANPYAAEFAGARFAVSCRGSGRRAVRVMPIPFD